MDKDASLIPKHVPPPLARRTTQLVWSAWLTGLAGLFVFLSPVSLPPVFLPPVSRSPDSADMQGDPTEASNAPSKLTVHRRTSAFRPLNLRIELNQATSRELSLLPGIGPKLAERILQDRQRSGPFQSLADLTRVSGIGPRTIERIGSMVDVARPAISIAANRRSLPSSMQHAGSP